ncbi:MAG: DUF4157 domain-containing protein [Leptolyngbyaceae cyanobacterium SL_7_1]|nr:DUF4157 domain-containing protein [Leptolyngbyaceae cyanobacterium SL_7_1]
MQRQCACGKSAGLTGQCSECQSQWFTKQPESAANPASAPILHELIQPKLRVGEPGDRYEQEADRIAEQVIRMPNPQPTPPLTIQRLDPVDAKPLQRQEIEDEEEEISTVQEKGLASPTTLPISPAIEERLQRQEDHISEAEDRERAEDDQEETIQANGLFGQSLQVTPTLEERLQASRGKGQPLPIETRSFMESRFGHDFSQIRIHSDGEAAQMNRELAAQAFTHRQDIYFATGHYNPQSQPGRQLLAHELVHTIQQTTPTRLEPQSVQPRQLHSEVPPATKVRVPVNQIVYPASEIAIQCQERAQSPDPVVRIEFFRDERIAIATGRSGQTYRGVITSLDLPVGIYRARFLWRRGAYSELETRDERGNVTQQEFRALFDIEESLYAPDFSLSQFVIIVHQSYSTGVGQPADDQGDVTDQPSSPVDLTPEERLLLTEVIQTSQQEDVPLDVDPTELQEFLAELRTITDEAERQRILREFLDFYQDMVERSEDSSGASPLSLVEAFRRFRTMSPAEREIMRTNRELQETETDTSPPIDAQTRATLQLDAEQSQQTTAQIDDLNQFLGQLDRAITTEEVRRQLEARRGNFLISC